MSFDGTAVVLNQKHGSCATGLFVSSFWVVRASTGAKRRRKQAEQHVRFALQERECCFLYLKARGSAQWSKHNGICRHWRHGVMQAELQPDVAVHVHSGLLWGVQCQGFAKWDASCQQVKVVAMRCLQSDQHRVQLQQCFLARREWHPEPVFSEDEVDELHSESSEESDSSLDSRNYHVTSSMARFCSSLPRMVAKDRARQLRLRAQSQSSNNDSDSDSDSDFVLESGSCESIEGNSTKLSFIDNKEVKMLRQLASKWYAPVKKFEQRPRVKTEEVKHESTEQDETVAKAQGRLGVRASRSIACKLLFGGICNGDAYWAKYTVKAFWRSTQSHHFPKSYVRANLHRVANTIQCYDGFIHKCDLVARIQ